MLYDKGKSLTRYKRIQIGGIELEMNKIQMLIKAIYAGVMIGIGGVVYLSIENKMAGSFFFSFGLLTIVTQSFALYTGKIGFVTKWKELLDMGIIIIGNFIGTFLTAFVCKMADVNFT